MKQPVILCITSILLFSCTKETIQKNNSAISSSNNSSVTISSHYIGEHFGGGTIFWMTRDSVHGLIADTSDLGNFMWWNGSYTNTNANLTGIGKEKFNTRKIIYSQGKEGNYAVIDCTRSHRSGYTDWFLPTKDELLEMYKQRNFVGRLSGYYWSCSEQTISAAWAQSFVDASQQSINKSNSLNVRAVRAF